MPVSPQDHRLLPRLVESAGQAAIGVEARSIGGCVSIRGGNGRALYDCEDGIVTESAEEGAQPIRTIPTTAMPTQVKIDLHRITHIPNRCWCLECVEGVARERPHRHKKVERLIPLFSCDCECSPEMSSQRTSAMAQLASMCLLQLN